MPASTADKQFAAKHPIQVVDPLDDDRAENNDKWFRGATHEYDRDDHRFGYDAGEDETVYEDEIDPEYQETLVEISKKVLGNYVKKAAEQSGYVDNGGLDAYHDSVERSNRRQKGIVTAFKKAAGLAKVPAKD